jgi:purine catabolism regulator
VKLIDAHYLTVLRRARIVAGKHGLNREVRWVHIVDMPDVLPWVRPGQLLLTTGYSWPREPGQQQNLIRALAEKKLAGVGLAVPRFFEHFSETFRVEADRLDLPLLEIPWEIPFAQITEELHTLILGEQTRLIEQSERIHRSLTRAALEADSLQDIAETLGDLIHRAVTIEDPEGSVLGYYRIAEMEDNVRRESLQKGHSPPDFLKYLRDSGSQQLIDQATAPIRIPPAAALGFTGRIVCPIWLKGKIVGRVWIIEGDEPLSDLDLRAAEHAATVAALQIAHQQALASVEVRVGYSFLSALLEGRFESTPQSLERARLQGFSLDALYRVGLLVMDESVPLSHEGVIRRDRLAERLRQRLQQLGIPPLISVSLNQIPFLLPLECDGGQIWSELVAPEIAFAVSRPYPGIAGVRQAYVEALEIAPHVRFGTFCRFEDVLLPRVLAGDVSARQVFLKDIFDPLTEMQRGEIWTRTLIAFVEADFHLKRAAKTLHIHPKSLRYRLGRISSLIGMELNSPDVRFQLQLAVRLLSIDSP